MNSRQVELKKFRDMLIDIYTSNKITQDLAQEIAIMWENHSLCFWFNRDEVPHFDKFQRIQVYRYDNKIRFANNNYELLQNKYWKSMMSGLIKRVRAALGERCPNGEDCKFYKEGWCRNPH